MFFSDEGAQHFPVQLLSSNGCIGIDWAARLKALFKGQVKRRTRKQAVSGGSPKTRLSHSPKTCRTQRGRSAGKTKNADTQRRQPEQIASLVSSIDQNDDIEAFNDVETSTINAPASSVELLAKNIASFLMPQVTKQVESVRNAHMV